MQSIFWVICTASTWPHSPVYSVYRGRESSCFTVRMKTILEIDTEKIMLNIGNQHR